MLDEDSTADKSKKPILFGIVLVFVLYGASFGRTFAQIDRYEHLSASWREYAYVTTGYWSVPFVLIGSLLGFVVGIVIERRVDGPIPYWILLLAIALLPLWLFDILLFPAMPPP